MLGNVPLRARILKVDAVPTENICNTDLKRLYIMK